MKFKNRATCLLSGLFILASTPAFAGNDVSKTVSAKSATETCKTEDGRSLCSPQGATEEIVPEYYDVPTVTKHIYYKKPTVQPVVTHVVHHVPTPVYGGKAVVQKVEAGPWTGAPVATCCNQAVVPPARPTYEPVHVQPSRPVTYMRSNCQAWYHQPRPCR